MGSVDTSVVRANMMGRKEVIDHVGSLWGAANLMSLFLVLRLGVCALLVHGCCTGRVIPDIGEFEGRFGPGEERLQGVGDSQVPRSKLGGRQSPERGASQ